MTPGPLGARRGMGATALSTVLDDRDSSLARPLNILFIHQNFPGQYKHLAPALARRGHQVVALGLQQGVTLPGVRLVNYRITPTMTEGIHPLASEIEVKVIRGEAVARACKQLQAEGFTPAVIYVHPAWGEALFLREVFPAARLVMFCEYFYRGEGQDVNTDPEFPPMAFSGRCKLRLKNTCTLHAFEVGDAFVSPTRWQRNTYPEALRERIRVIHDGLDFAALTPRPGVALGIPGGGHLGRDDKVLTYVARNLEPTRGFHWFMRALPALQAAHPDAQVVIVGGAQSGYGQARSDGRSWPEAMLAELAGQLDDSRLHFLGPLAYEHYLTVLSISSAHVYLSYPFVLSWSVLEAMAMGVPVLSNHVAGLEEFAPQGDGYTPVALEHLSEAMIGALNAPGPTKPAGLERIELQHCLDQQYQLLAELTGE